MSDSPEDCADVTRLERTRFPRLSRIDVGKSNLISFANDERRDDGSRDVVTKTRGSTMPESCAYSSSRSSSSFAVRSGRDSSYL